MQLEGTSDAIHDRVNCGSTRLNDEVRLQESLNDSTARTSTLERELNETRFQLEQAQQQMALVNDDARKKLIEDLEARSANLLRDQVDSAVCLQSSPLFHQAASEKREKELKAQQHQLQRLQSVNRPARSTSGSEALVDRVVRLEHNNPNQTQLRLMASIAIVAIFVLIVDRLHDSAIHF